MAVTEFPVIDLTATGRNITRLRKAKGLSVRDIQTWYGFEEPQAIYKWQHGKCLPTVDNLVALSVLLEVPMNEILVLTNNKPESVTGQQAESCCSDFLAFIGCFRYDRVPSLRPPIELPDSFTILPKRGESGKGGEAVVIPITSWVGIINPMRPRLLAAISILVEV